jgi:hypothetical protein
MGHSQVFDRPALLGLENDLRDPRILVATAGDDTSPSMISYCDPFNDDIP